MNDEVPAEDVKILQPESKAQEIQHRGSRPQESYACNEEPNSWKTWPHMGRPLQSHPLFLTRKLPPRVVGRLQVTVSLERRTPKEVSPVGE